MLWGSAGRRGYYGVETPGVPAIQAFLALVMMQLGQTSLADGDNGGWWLFGFGGVLLAIAVAYLHASRRGRFRAWSRALGELELAGTEQILDVGCGRGAVTTLAAARVPEGGVIGVDNWRSPGFLASRKHGTDEEIAQRNASAEGVAQQVRYHAADIDDLPIENNTFDLVVSGGGVSTLPSRDRRATAIDEAVRVTKPGGRLLIGDVRNTGAYAVRLRELGCEDVRATSMGPETWYGGPWLPLVLVSARKPA